MSGDAKASWLKPAETWQISTPAKVICMPCRSLAQVITERCFERSLLRPPLAIIHMCVVPHYPTDLESPVVLNIEPPLSRPTIPQAPIVPLFTSSYSVVDSKKHRRTCPYSVPPSARSSLRISASPSIFFNCVASNRSPRFALSFSSSIALSCRVDCQPMYYTR